MACFVHLNIYQPLSIFKYNLSYNHVGPRKPSHFKVHFKQPKNIKGKKAWEQRRMGMLAKMTRANAKSEFLAGNGQLVQHVAKKTWY